MVEHYISKHFKQFSYESIINIIITKLSSTTTGVKFVTEQHYVSIFFTHLWSVRKPLLFDTQNPRISGFSTAAKTLS